MEKSMIIDAIIGRGFKSITHACDMTKSGLAEFCGNQWNKDWRWRRIELEKLGVRELQDIYSGDKL